MQRKAQNMLTITIDGEKIETHTLDRFNAPKFGINIDQQKRIQV